MRRVRLEEDGLEGFNSLLMQARMDDSSRPVGRARDGNLPARAEAAQEGADDYQRFFFGLNACPGHVRNPCLPGGPDLRWAGRA